MSAKKVLIVTYYWPPSGGSGVQRWLKFVKYLCKSGWEPMVFTPENPSFTIRDESLLKEVPVNAEVIALPIWEPYKVFFFLSKLMGRKPPSQADFVTRKRKGLLQTISTWIRGNLLIPDARIFWVKPAVSVLSDLIISNHIEKIITTGPPHSIHLIGLRLKKKFPALKWIADFRDPWSEWDLLDSLLLTKWARNRHKRLEKEVLTRADRVITIAPYHVHRFEQLGNREVNLITNGFDTEDFAMIDHEKTEQFTIRHMGIVDELRDPRPFLRALKQIFAQNREIRTQIRVEFVGNVNAHLKTEVEADPLLSAVIRFVPYKPHAELLQLFGQTDLLLLVLANTMLAKGNLPGKFFEYLASGNTILGVGPTDGDAATILHETEAGKIFTPTDTMGIQAFLLSQFDRWQRNEKQDRVNRNKFSREALTRQLIELLESL